MSAVITPYTHAGKILLSYDGWTNGYAKIALVTSAYTFNSAHTAYSDFSANEVTAGNGYLTGGVSISGTVSDTAINASTVIFDTISKSFRYGIVYIDNTVLGIVKPLLFHILFNDTAGGTDIVTTESNFNIQWNASRVATISLNMVTP